MSTKENRKLSEYINQTFWIIFYLATPLIETRMWSLVWNTPACTRHSLAVCLTCNLEEKENTWVEKKYVCAPNLDKSIFHCWKYKPSSSIRKDMILLFLVLCRPQEWRMVPDGFTLACALYRNFIPVFREEPWSLLDEKQTCLQPGPNHSDV